MARGRPKKEKPEEQDDNRSYTWTCLVYPESLPDGWESILDEEHFRWACSPLHENDINPGSDELKKPHYHLMFCFESLKSYEQVLRLTKLLNGPIPKRVMSTRAMARYLCHLDNPEKAQYKVEDIRCFGGLEIKDLMKVGFTERLDLERQMMRWVKANNIVEMADLMDYAEEQNEDWLSCISQTSRQMMDIYIRSRRHKRQQEQSRTITIDTDTGEIQG